MCSFILCIPCPQNYSNKTEFFKDGVGGGGGRDRELGTVTKNEQQMIHK